MSNSLISNSDSKIEFRWKTSIIVALLIMIGAISGWWYFTNTPTRRLDLPPVITQDAFEEATGLKINLVALTGGGGFIDFRVKVIDPKKATDLFSKPENTPILVVEKAGVTLNLPEKSAYEGAQLEEGRAYYLLYPNVQGVVEAGDSISVVIGEFRHAPIAVQGRLLP